MPNTMIQGQNKIIMLRALKNDTKEKANLVLFQTSHQWKTKSKTDTIETKSGNVPVQGAPEITLSVSYIETWEDDAISTKLKEYSRTGEKMEIWEIDLTKAVSTAPNKNEFKAEYARGIITDFSVSYKSGDTSDASVDLNIEGTPKNGKVTFNNEQTQLLYEFRDLDKVTTSGEKPGNKPDGGQTIKVNRINK